MFTLTIPSDSDSFWVEYIDCYVEYSMSELQRLADELGVSFEYYFHEFL